MKRIAPFLLVVALPVIALAESSAEAWRTGWPQAPGPNFDWAALDTGVALVDDLAKGKVVWASEAALPRAKAYSSTDGQVKGGLPTGGGYGPIMTDGRLYQWHYLPAGETAQAADGRARPFFRNIATTADLHLVCMDPADGITLWRRILPGVAPNFQGSKSVAPQNLTPCAANGRVFALGPDGRLYAFRSRDGELLWERPLAGLFADAQADRATDLLGRQCSGGHVHHTGDAPLVSIADRVFVNVEDKLLAFDAVTGAPVWELKDKVSGYFYPLPWGQRVLVSGPSGIHCLDAATGKPVWLHKGLDVQSRLYLHGDKLIVLAARQVPKRDKSGGTCFYASASQYEAYGTPACYRLTETGLERLWGTADQFKGTVESLVVCVSAKLCAVRGDTLYLATPGYVEGGAKLLEKGANPATALQPGQDNLIGVKGKPSGLLALDLNTGAVRARLEPVGGGGEFYFQRIEDRLWADNDCGHDSQQNSWTDIGAKPPRTLNGKWEPPWLATVPYTNYMNKDLVDGRMFVRTGVGLTCFDFRADPKAGYTPVPFALPKWAESLPAEARSLAGPRLRERKSGGALSAAAALQLLTEGDYNTRRAVRQLGVPVPGTSALLMKLVAEGLGDSAYQVAQVTEDKALVEPLTQRAAGKEPLPVRRAAILALAGLRAKDACPVLVKLLDDAEVNVVAARALGRLADGDTAALTALGARLRSKDLPVAYACADALRALAGRNGVPAETAAAIVKGIGELKPARDETEWPALLAADKLGEPGKELMLRVVAAAGALTKGASYRSMLQSILPALLAAGVPATDERIQKAAAANGLGLEMYAKAKDETKTDSKAGPYVKFWQAVDADAVANGSPDQAW